ncbi:Tat pathway signal sequence domain protein, partial [Neisseria sp. oral taxon 020 str. F0370]
MADKRLDSMNEYEQLKRKNRRRLVGASAMVVVAGIVFGAAVGSGSEDAPAEPATVAAAPQPEPLTLPPDQPEEPAEQDDSANDTFEMPSDPVPEAKPAEAKPVYELKEGQETVEQTDADGSVRTVVKKAEPARYDRGSEPVVTINNTNKQAAEKAKRKEAEKAAEAKRLAQEKQREEAERRAEAERIAAEEKAVREQKLAEERSKEERKRRAEEKRAADREARLKQEELAQARKEAELKKRAEARKAAEEKRLAETQKREEAKQAAEEKRLAELKKRREEQKQAEERRLADQKKQLEAKKQTEEKRLAEQKKRQEAEKQQAE